MAFFIFIITNLALFFLGRRLARMPRAWRYGLLAACTAGLLIRSWLLLRPDLEVRLFPHVDYLQYQGLWLYALASAFFGLASGLLPQRGQKRVLVILFLIVFSWGTYTSLWLILPEAHGRKTFPDPATHHLTQSSGITCGPASCSMAASYFGIRVSELEMARRCLTQRMGTTVFNVYRGLKLTLPEDRFSLRIAQGRHEEMVREGQVSLVMWDALHHVICVVGNGRGVKVHDPLRPRPKQWTLQELQQVHSGYAVMIVSLQERERSDNRPAEQRNVAWIRNLGYQCGAGSPRSCHSGKKGAEWISM